MILRLLIEPTTRTDLMDGLKRIGLGRTAAYDTINALESQHVIHERGKRKHLELTDPDGLERVIDAANECATTMHAQGLRDAQTFAARKKARLLPPDLPAEELDAIRRPSTVQSDVPPPLADADASVTHFVYHGLDDEPVPEELLDRAASYDPVARVLHVNLAWRVLTSQYRYWETVYSHFRESYSEYIRDTVLDEMLDHIHLIVLYAEQHAANARLSPVDEVRALVTPEALTAAAFPTQARHVALKKKLAQRLGSADSSVIDALQRVSEVVFEK